MKTLLMIRDEQLAADFVTALGAVNPVVYAPMVTIEWVNADQPIPAADVLIFTSSNAVRAYCKAIEGRSAKAICVGSVTAKATRDQGIEVSKTCETVEALIADVKGNQDQYPSILYPRGEVVSVDIAQALSDTDINLTEVILYKQTFHDLPQQGINEIESSLVVVPILSKEIAVRFLEAITTLNSRNVTIICISPAVAEIFKDSTGFTVQIAPKPTRAALIQMVQVALSA